MQHQDRDPSHRFIVISGESSERVGRSRPPGVTVCRTKLHSVAHDLARAPLRIVHSRARMAREPADRSPLAIRPRLPQRRKAHTKASHSEQGSVPASPALPPAAHNREPAWRAARRHERS
ncbi:hypothetical protein EI94DRAFT_641896 [Lactarius quietus]|nr:hypothetical protein EI94DRAFT_641896 [Lactarius quietus]